MEPQQQRLSRVLGVCADRPFFDHPTTEEPVFFMFDPPHLMKSIRNALVNYDIGFEGGFIASWKFVKALWSLDTVRSLRLVPRLTAKHIFLGLGKKMSVRLAVQVFSHSVHAGLMTYKERGLLPSEAEQTAVFIKQMNDLWDAFNCSDLHGRGLKQVITRGNLFDRLRFLDVSASFIQSLTFHHTKNNVSKTYLPSKTGLLVTISAYKALARRLLCDSPARLNFLIGRRLNQDCVENCFSQVRRDKGSFYEMMPCWRALGNLKCVAASTFLAHVRKSNANCQGDDDSVLVDLFHTLKETGHQKKGEVLDLSFSEISSQSQVSRESISSRSSSQAAIQEMWRNSLENKQQMIESDASEYVSGYIVHKLLSKETDISNCTVCLLSITAETDEMSPFFSYKSFVNPSTGLQCPSAEFVTMVSTWDRQFRLCFNSVCRQRQLRLCISKILFSKCVSVAHFLPDCHKKCILEFCLELFVKIRIFKEVKTCNHNLKRDRVASLRKLSKLNQIYRSK